MVRLTPALAVVALLTSILVVWLVVDVVHHDIHANVFVNVIIVATGLSWLYWLGERREQDRRQPRQQESETVDDAIRRFMSS
jgi:Flp pilus assembly protein TadB